MYVVFNIKLRAQITHISKIFSHKVCPLLYYFLIRLLECCVELTKNALTIKDTIY